MKKKKQTVSPDESQIEPFKESHRKFMEFQRELMKELKEESQMEIPESSQMELL